MEYGLGLQSKKVIEAPDENVLILLLMEYGLGRQCKGYYGLEP